MNIDLKKWFHRKDKTEKKSLREQLGGKSSRHGSYSIVYTVLALAVLVFINLIAGELPSRFTKFDLSGSGLYSIGDQTKEVLDGLTEDVTLYLVAQEDNEDTAITNLLEQYEEASSHIRVVHKDPVKSPAFTSAYTSQQLYDNSIIVECGERNRIIDYDSIYSGDYDYYSGSYSVTEFDGEGQLTSAIAYVTSRELPVLYVVGGHNEAEISDTLRNTIEKENVQIEELNLVTADEVPEDASCLFLYAPMEDYSEAEAQTVLRYLEKGGNALVVTSYTEKELPNFQSILRAYGLETGAGLVLEGDSSYTMSQNPLYIVPDYESHTITESLADGNRYVVTPIAQSVEILEEYRDTLDIEPLLTTSDAAYEKANPANMDSYARESTDREGPFILGVAVTETLDEGETKLVYYTTEGLLDDTMNRAVSGGNMELFSNSLSFMVDHEVSVSIAAKSMDVTYLTVNSRTANLWSILAVAVLPLAVLAAGGVVCYKRRKR